MPVVVLLDGVLPPEWLPEAGGPWTVEVLPRPGTHYLGRQVPHFDSLDDYFANEAQGILMKMKDEHIVFVIEAHIQLTSWSRATDYEGIECLKHIRLTHDLTWEEDHDGKPRKRSLGRSHAIVHSWSPLSKILSAKPGNLILCTEGVTFVPTLHVEHLLKDGKALDNLLKKQADIEGDLAFSSIRADYTPPVSDHDTSNWWGVRQLVLGAEAIEGTKNGRVVPTSVESELKKLYNKKAFFLAGAKSISADREEARGHRSGLKKLRKFFKDDSVDSRLPKIVYVDDEMDKGWGEAVYFILTGRHLPKPEGSAWFHTTMGLLAQPGNSSEDWRSLANMILDQKPDLILTDLRLLGGLESTMTVRQTSGAKLVSLLREEAPAVPILLMTASNKAWTFQEAFRLGVDAYWMKEGIGDHAAPSTSVRNAAELVRLIQSLLGKDYQALRRIQDHIRRFEDEWDTPTPPWWKEMEWPLPVPPLNPPEPGGITKPDKRKSFELLQNLAGMYREYLRLFILGYGPVALTADRNEAQRETKEEAQDRTQRKEETADFWVRSLVVQVGRVIECVHCIDAVRKLNKGLRGRPKYESGGTIGAHRDPFDPHATQRMRRDWFGQGLYGVRNIAAHYNPRVSPIQHENVRSLLAALFAWLSTKPETRDCTSVRWPGAKDLFSGPYRDEDLVREYRSLFGSEGLILPSDPDYP